MKEFLSQAGRTFKDRNVEEDPEAHAELAALGVRTVPLTVIGARLIKGFDEQVLQDALTDAGEP